MSQSSESGESPTLDLPPPVIEAASVVGSEQLPVIEKQSDSVEVGSVPKTPVISNPPIPQISLPPQQSMVSDPVSAPAQTTVTVPATADDNDLIEKEWVSKAKVIVNSNREDPYNQTKEMNIFRADYMKKRYNKIIKISE